MGPRAHEQAGSLSPQLPGPAPQEFHQEASFVPADQPRGASRVFFNARPVPLNPQSYAPIVAFFGRDLRALRSQPAGAQEAVDMIGMIGDLEAILQELHNARTGPQGASENLQASGPLKIQRTRERRCGTVSQGGRPEAG